MRWVVELPAPTGGTGASVTVESESWKAALSLARNGRPVSRFRGDFEDDGTVRVWDMVTNERFVVRPLAVPATPSGSPIAEAPGPTAQAPAAAAVTAESQADTPIPLVRVSDRPPPRPEPTPPAPARLFFARGHEPTRGRPLTFLERVYVVPADTDVSTARNIAKEMWQVLRESVRGRGAGQFISIAIFDHVFASKPSTPPLVVLSWKDWHGAHPTIVVAGARPTVETAPSTVKPPPEAPPRADGSERPASAAPSRTPHRTLPLTPEAKTLRSPSPAETPPPAAAFAPEPNVVTVAPVASVGAPLPSSTVKPPLAASTTVTSPPASPPAPPSPAPSSPRAQEAATPAPSAAAATPNAPSPPAAEPAPSAPPRAPASAAVSPTPPVSTLASTKSIPPRPISPESLATSTISKPPPAPSASASPSVSFTAPRPSTPPVDAPTVSQDDLLVDAFEAMQDLAFLTDSVTACEFVAPQIRRLTESAVCLVYLYEINRDELVLSFADGYELSTGTRVPATSGPRGEAAIRNRVVVLSEPVEESSANTAPPGGAVMFVPVRHDHRLFGVIETHRARGVRDYSGDQQQVAIYVAAQLGEFLSQHSRRIGFKDDSHKR